VDIITIDFETFYDSKYSLSKMQTDAYILDPLFQIIGVSVKINDNPGVWYPWSDEFEFKFRVMLEWDKCAVLCHHTLFDGFIMTQKLGIKPKLWMCTLSMSRALYPWLMSHSLAKLSEHHGLGPKGTEVVNNIGLRREDFSPQRLAKYGEYCVNDGELTYENFMIMQPNFPAIEFQLVDITMRMFTEPLLQLDEAKLVEYHKLVVEEKAKLLEKANVTKEDIMSNEKFSMLLINAGVEPPVKMSPATGTFAWAFAKTDEAFTALQEHPDSLVQALVAARLGVKTTIAETRAMRFIETAQRGIGFPVFLNYWGAKTTGRYSGGNKINAQNLQARGKDRVIREAIIAPPGYKIVVGDSSNIELRVNLAMAGQTDLIDKIRMYDAQGEAATSDLYCDFASMVYGRPVTKKDADDRFMGKTSELGLGYGCGDVKFDGMVTYLSKGKTRLEPGQAKDIVDLYRLTHDKVVSLWKRCNNVVLKALYNSNIVSVDVNDWVIAFGEGFAIPGNIGVVYKDLALNNDAEWEYTAGRKRVKIYGGKMCENLSQHAARHIVMWQLARVARKYKVVLTVHDEIVCCVPEDQAEACAEYMLESLRLAPKWCRGGIPLNGEVGIGNSYGEAK
jgi:DNA polymerase